MPQSGGKKRGKCSIPVVSSNTDGTLKIQFHQSQNNNHITHLSTAPQLPKTVLKHVERVDLSTGCDLLTEFVMGKAHKRLPLQRNF
jgi:hypothetical protein